MVYDAHIAHLNESRRYIENICFSLGEDFLSIIKARSGKRSELCCLLDDDWYANAKRRPCMGFRIIAANRKHFGFAEIASL